MPASAGGTASRSSDSSWKTIWAFASAGKAAASAERTNSSRRGGPDDEPVLRPVLAREQVRDAQGSVDSAVKGLSISGRNQFTVRTGTRPSYRACSARIRSTSTSVTRHILARRTRLTLVAALPVRRQVPTDDAAHVLSRRRLVLAA